MASALMQKQPFFTSMRRRHRQKGVTLVEILISSVIGALIAGGTMTAFMLAARNTRASMGHADMAALFQESFEKIRNSVSCENSLYFDGSCNPVTVPGANDNDPIPASHPFKQWDPAATRTVDVEAYDCDGLPGNDCLKVIVKIHWDPRV